MYRIPDTGMTGRIGMTGFTGITGITDITEVGRALGHDLHRFNRLAGREDWPRSVAEGFEQARARRLRCEAPDRFERKWLQLRLSALRRQRIVADDVTPDLLREIDVEYCPVTRQRLTHGELLDSDWSIDRLNNDGAYARNNLAVMSTRANLAKGHRSFEHVYALSEKHEATDGLSPVEWLRLAALMLGPCFALQPRLAPAIPLAAPMPTRTARPVVQLIQHVLTSLARTPAGKNALIKHYRPACVDESSRQRFKLLAEALHAGMKQQAHLHDAWLKPGVMDALLHWRAAMSESSWALAGEISRRLTGSGLLGPQRLARWAVDARGYLS